MRYLALLMMMGFFHLQAQQKEVDKLIKQGQVLFEHELYKDAINKYKQAIAFDKKCAEAHYELAYTYLTIKDDDEALFYCRNVLGLESEYWLDALLVYGALLNNKGNHKQAIKEYKKALHKYPNEFLLYHNMAESYLMMNEKEKAEEAAIKCLKINNLHLPSHVLLASIMKRKGEVLKSMLPLYYCLLLEVDDEKKDELLDDVQVRWHVSLVQKAEVSEPVSKHTVLPGLQVAESKLNAIARQGMLNETPEPYRTIDRTIALIQMLSVEQTGEMDYFDIQYVDFFKQLHIAGHTESFSYFICSSKYNAEVLAWVNDNKSAFNAFINWMEIQQ